MSEGTLPGLPPNTSNKVMFRNIITGVITTVLGATIIYFLFHNSGGSGKAGFLETREATTKAWKSYVTIDNIYYKNLLSISKDQQLLSNLDNYKNELFREAARFKKDAENILKDKDIDKSFISMVERRFERETESEEAVSKYIDKLKVIVNSNTGPEEKKQNILTETQTYQKQANGILERAATEVEDLSKTLGERYGQPFNLNDFMFYTDYKKGLFNNSGNTNNTNNKQTNNPGQPDPNLSTNNTINNADLDETMFAGRWNITGANIELTPDGKMNWDMDNGDYAYGTWKFLNNQLIMYATSRAGQNATWIFNLSNVTGNMFTMTLNVQPYTPYTMVRVKE